MHLEDPETVTGAVAWPVPLRCEQVVEVGVDVLPVDVEVLTEAAGVFEPDGLQHGPGGTVARRARKRCDRRAVALSPTRTASPVTAVGGGDTALQRLAPALSGLSPYL